jgi:IrrE N-terminal-like domain
LSDLSEVNFAKRLIDREKLRPPIDVVATARKFARVEHLRLPVDVDGVCLNLKRRGHQPRILVNTAGRSKERIRFTLAHELGHVIIPWHTGSIVDTIDIDRGRIDLHYSTLEAEANRFASELLMPTGWMKEKIDEFPCPPDAIRHVARSAEVSLQAAMIRVHACHGPGIVYAEIHNGFVVASGRSNGTLADPPQPGTAIDPRSLFPWTPHRWEANMTGTSRHFWWQFKGDVALPSADTNEDWRELLDKIINDIKIPGNDVTNFKARINGIISHANGRRKTDRTSAQIFEACLERLHSRAEEDNFIRLTIKHQAFPRFLYARVLAFMK